MFPDLAAQALLVARLFSEECYGRKIASASLARASLISARASGNSVLASGNPARASGNSARASVCAGGELARAGAGLSSPRRRILWMRLRNFARRLARKRGRKS